LIVRRRPIGVADRTSDDRVAVIVLSRRLRMTAAEIAETLAMPLSTVSVVLKRQGLGRLGRIGLEQPQRYERSKPGELVHVDLKKLGRIRGVGHRISGNRASQGKIRIDGRLTAGWEYVPHRDRRPTAGPPRSRSTTTRKRQQRPPSCTALSPSSPATGSVSSVCSPTTAPPTARSSTPRLPPPRHPTPRPRPYRPQTNGKAEPFIRTLLAGCAHGPIYGFKPRTHRSP
jgi:hypothetical protein